MDEKEKIIEQLSAYLDGELDGADAGRVERAVRADPDLAAQLDQLRAVRGLLRSLPRQRAPRGFVEAVGAKAERLRLVGAAEARTSNRAVQWVRYLATAAVLLVAVSVGALVVATLWKTSREYAPAAGPDLPGPIAAAPADTKADDAPAFGARESGVGRRPAGARDIRKDNGLAAIDALRRGGRLADALDHAEIAIKEDMFTDDLWTAVKEVENVFRANGIVRQVAMTDDGRGRLAMEREAEKGLAPGARRENFFQAQTRGTKQVQFVVVALPEQTKRVLAGLKAVRARQEARQASRLKERHAAKPVCADEVGGVGAAKAPAGGARKKAALAKARALEPTKKGEGTPLKPSCGPADKPSGIAPGEAAEKRASRPGLRPAEALAGKAGDPKAPTGPSTRPAIGEEQVVRGLNGECRIKLQRAGDEKDVNRLAPAQSQWAPAPVTAPARSRHVRTAPGVMRQWLIVTLNYRALAAVPAARLEAKAGKALLETVEAGRKSPTTREAEASQPTAAEPAGKSK